MPSFVNKRPSLIGLPNGSFVMPGAACELDDTAMGNPAVKKWIRAGWLKPAGSTTTEAAAMRVDSVSTTDGRTGRRLADVATADGETLLRMAAGETDEQVLAAINRRAAELVDPC